MVSSFGVGAVPILETAVIRFGANVNFWSGKKRRRFGLVSGRNSLQHEGIEDSTSSGPGGA